jgi:hypothetical protein
MQTPLGTDIFIVPILPMSNTSAKEKMGVNFVLTLSVKSNVSKFLLINLKLAANFQKPLVMKETANNSYKKTCVKPYSKLTKQQICIKK